MIWVRAIKLLIISLILLLCACTKSNLVETKTVEKLSYLYIKTPDNVGDFDTITYLFTHSSPTKKLEKNFRTFSRVIGENSAFVVISPNSSLELYNSLKKIKNRCDFPSSRQWPSILFQDSRLNKCYIFNIPENQETKYTIVLSEIIDAIETKKSLNKYEFKESMEKNLEKLLKTHPEISNLKEPFIDLISYISDKIYN
ncbi:MULTISPECIES: hypothetical protein [Pseudoalteromonas]|uniref:Lipoprotein n=1 Tax=Pseudoalteromonas amylolytica TaxID=1859457 RepID=A0A1S1N059_9GAMM|nr:MULTISPECIES: hypothetical protein [Pseudoalteromonas]OHU90586.1 hypothetical protein BFC16_02985 [Pseudoalteromonas sp. JW3]OHU92793.1 hypothetical protein BET10_04910 [Pseudoalteromonas amylolytica]